MGRLRTIGRRAVLVGAAAITGGVAFGAYLVKRPLANPLLDGLAEGDAAFNPYVKITAEGITLILPHADFGQGVQSAQAALIAEELDVELDQVALSFGRPDPAYYNTALAGELAPFQSFDESLAARTVRGALTAAVKVMGVMGTGGSSSVADQYEKLRLAGAVARETLKRAAARVSGVAVEALTTARGAVILPDGSALAYTALAATAAGLDPAPPVPLRDPATWRLLGKPMRRTDIVAKSTGTLTYGIDVAVEGMVHAAVRVNPRQGGEMLGHDASGAEGMRGVQEILVIEGDIWTLDARGRKSARRGPIGVAVVADNSWRAFRALEAIAFDWGPAHYPAEMADHWAAIAASFTDERLDKEWRHDGDVEAALAGAPVVIEAEYRAPYVAHAPLEPLNAVVRVDDDGAEVWTGHQLPRFAQAKVAAAAGLGDPDRVVLHNQFIGGSFGHRLEFDHLVHATDIARRMKGVPVKLTYSREEDFAHDFPRQIGMSRSRGAVRGGHVDAWDIAIATPSSTNSQSARLGQPTPGPDIQIAAGVWNMALAVPNLRVRSYRVHELAPISSWRSVGAATQGFFAESFLDELCHAAGADPLAERLRLVSNDVHRKVLEAVGEMSDWGAGPPPGRGRGLAMVESFGVPVAEVVEVAPTAAGLRIERVWVALDAGPVLDPVNFDNLVKGGVIWGLGHAMNCEITYSDGRAEQANYYDHEAMRLAQCPVIEVLALENAPKIRGIGEPPVPPAAPALGNAIFAATGLRLREMPFAKSVAFA